MEKKNVKIQPITNINILINDLNTRKEIALKGYGDGSAVGTVDAWVNVDGKLYIADINSVGLGSDDSVIMELSVNTSIDKLMGR